MSNRDKRPSLAEEVISYVNMRVDALKLSLVENLSVIASGGFGILIFIVFLSMALLCFIAAFTVWLAELIGSAVFALLIVGGVFLIVSVVAFAMRDRIIVDRMVRMFSRMFFEKSKDDDENISL